MAEGNNYAGSFKTDTFVLVDVPLIEDKHEYLTDYLESTLVGVGVHNLSFHPGVPHRVLVMLSEAIDLNEAQSLVSDVPLEDQRLRVEQAEEMNAVIVEEKELQEKLTLFFLKLYFQSEFGDSEEVVTNCVQIPQSSEIAVHFRNCEVTKKVLEHQIHEPLPTEGYTIQVKPFFANFHGLIAYKGQQFLRTLELEENLDSPQSEDSAIQETNEENQNKYNHYVEKKTIKETTPEADLKWHVDTTPAHEDRKARERIIHKNMETNFHSLNYSTSEIYSRDNDGFSLQDAGMGSKFLSINTAKGESQRMETRSEPKSVGKKIPDRQVSSSDHQTEMPVMDVIQSLSAMSIHSDRKVPQMAIGGNPEENKQRRSDEEFQLVLNKALWKLMKDKIKKESNIVTYDDEKEVLLVKGKNVSHFMKSYAELKNSVTECHIPLNEKMEMVLNSQYAKKYFTSVNYDAAYTIDRGYLDIYGFHEWSVNFMKQKVTEIIDNFEEINIPNNVSDDDFMWCKDHYEQLLPVHMSRDVNFVTINIIGKSDAVREVKDYLARMSTVRPQQDLERQWKQGSVQFLSTHYNLLMNFYGSELDDALKSVQYVWKPGQEGRVVIEFDGRLTDVKKAEEDLMTIQRSIDTEIIDVLAELGSTTNSLLIQRLSRPSEYDSLFYWQRSFEFENKCIIKNDVKTETSSQATGPSQTHGRGTKTSLPVGVNSERQKCSFRVCSSVQLEIKNYGDIVEEQSDVLVCFLPQNKSVMSTYVGQAFAKAIPRLEEKVNRLTFSANKVAFTEMDFPASPYVALVFMILPKPPDQKLFCQSVLEVLHKASDFGAHSVSFPPLGLGRMMKYSHDFISENFLSTLLLQSPYLAGTRLTKITFLATNQDLYEKMKNDASAYFTLISKSRERRGLDESFSVIEKQANGGYGVQEENVEIQIVHRNLYKVASFWKTRLQILITSTHETSL